MRLKTALLISLIFVTLFWPVLFGFGLVAGIVSLTDTEEITNRFEYEFYWGNNNSDQKILSIPIYGPIFDEKPDWGSFDPFVDTSVTYGALVKEKLYQAAEDDSLSGVILEINSPGGTVTGSKAISDGVEYYSRTTGKPVYSFASGLFASGAYWAAAATDNIVVENGSLVGSIGVVGGQFATYNNVVELNQGLLGTGVTTTDGIEVTTITSGEGKDFGNPFRPATEKELRIAQDSTDQVYSLFVDHVASNRHLDTDYIRTEVGAYVYGEGQAMDLGLIDSIGNKEQAYDQLRQTLGFEDSYQVVRYIQDGGFWGALFQASANKISQPSTESGPQQTSCVYSQRVMVYHGDITALCN